MPCLVWTTFLAAFACQLQPSAQTLRFEVQLFERKVAERVLPESSIFKKIPVDAKVLGSLTVSTTVGKPFHARATIGEETISVRGIVRALNRDEAELEVELEYCKEIVVPGANPD